MISRKFVDELHTLDTKRDKVADATAMSRRRVFVPTVIH
jgi:hypothetical protein